MDLDDLPGICSGGRQLLPRLLELILEAVEVVAGLIQRQNTVHR